MGNKHHVDDFFRAELKNIKVTPSVNVWQRIEKELDKPETHDTSSGIRRNMLLLALLFSLNLLLTSVNRVNEVSSHQHDANPAL